MRYHTIRTPVQKQNRSSMSTRIHIQTLLSDPEIGHIINSACNNGSLQANKLMSPKLVETLRILVKDNNASKSYEQIQMLAREAGVSDNLSKTTIKQGKELCGASSKGRAEANVNLVRYIVDTQITPLLIDSEAPPAPESIYSIVADVLVPVVILKAQLHATPDIVKHAPYAKNIMSGTEAGCALFVTLLKHSDLGLKTYNLQTLALKKTNAKLSYLTIQKIEQTAVWATENYRSHLKEYETVVVELVMIAQTMVNTLNLVKPKDLRAVVTDSLTAVLESAILSNSIKNKLLFKA